MTEFPDLVQGFQMALKALLMYTATHPRSQAAIATLAQRLDEWLETKPSIHIAASQNRLFLDGAPVEGKSVHMDALARQLSERQVSGIILLKGVTIEELEELLALFMLKPAKIEEAGGAIQIFAKKNLPHIQLGQTQYKEVREGEGGEEDKGGPAMSQAAKPAAEAMDRAAVEALEALAATLAGAGDGKAGAGAEPAPPPAPAFDIQILTDQWEEELSALKRPSLLDEAFEPANLGILGGTASGIGMGDNFPPAHQMEGLRRALLGLNPETLLSVVAGLDSLPSGHAGMRMAFQALAAEAFAQASAALIDGDSPWGAAKSAIFDTLRYAAQRQSMLAALEAELKGRAAGNDQLAHLQELIRQMDWEGQSMEEKLRLALEHDQLWSLSLDQRLRFMRRLLDEGRIEGLLSLLEQIIAALNADDVAHREMAAQTLTGITRWMADPGLPMEAEGPIIQGLSAHFCWEPLPHIHRATTEALHLLLNFQVNRGEPGHALDLLQEIAGLCTFSDNKQEWRETALAGLWRSLAAPDALRKVVELLHTANAESMLRELIPYFEAVGEPAGRMLVETLGNEPERKRRGRLLEAIRSLGDQALPAIYEGLESNSWFLVRNTLNLLADIGDAGALDAAMKCLNHPDGRVKRAAVRTLWKVGGPAAVNPLLPIFPVADPETQLEIMFGLGQVQAVQAIPILTEFALERRNPERMRARATEIIGQIGDTRAIASLAELARRKGRFFSSAEPLPIRLASLRALLAIGSQSALAAAGEVVAAEPWNKDRSTLQKIYNEQGQTGTLPASPS